MSRYESEPFIPWYTTPTVGWLELSAAARGVLISVAMHMSRDGEISLRRGLPSLAVLLRLPWEDVEPALGELVAAGKLQWDGAAFVLRDPDHAERKRPTSAERTRAWRERRSSAPPPPSSGVPSVTSRDVTGVTVTSSDVRVTACDVGDVASNLISSLSDLPDRIEDPDRDPPRALPPPLDPAGSELAVIHARAGEGPESAPRVSLRPEMPPPPADVEPGPRSAPGTAQGSPPRLAVVPGAGQAGRRKPETPCPGSDASADAVEAWAEGWRIPTGHAEFVGFLDHHRRRDERFRDWAAAWRTWLRRAPDFARPRSRASPARQPAPPGAPWLNTDNLRTLFDEPEVAP